MNGVINFQNYYSMELMFNELSLEPVSANKFEAIEKAKQFALTFSAGRKKGFQRIRAVYHYSEIKLSQDYSIQDFLFDKTLPHKDYKDLKDLLFGNINQPFIKEEDEAVEENYILSNINYHQNGSEHDCLGLAAAYLYDVPAISLNSSNEWQNNQININVEVGGVTNIQQVFNVYSNNCFSIPIIAQHIENLGDLELIETELKPEDKNLHLTGHHGKKELKNLWNKLKLSPFVISGLSIEWGGQNFIRKTTDKGIIEIVLPKSARQYAMQITSTGRNKRETEAIANNLRERYS